MDWQLPCVATVWRSIDGSGRNGEQSVVETIDVITEEWRKIADQGVTQAELDARKNILRVPIHCDLTGMVRLQISLQVCNFRVYRQITFKRAMIV